MKKLYRLFLLLAGIVVTTSCGEDEYTYSAPEALNVVKTDLYFKSAGGTGSIEIKTDRELKATSSVDWCTVSVSGSVITAKSIENTSIESRAGTITVSDGALTSLVAVYQEGLACSIDTSNLKSINSNSAGSAFITVDSSSPYTIVISQNATSWLSYTEDEAGKVIFTFTANTTGAPRGASVAIVSGSKKVLLPIFQYEQQDFVGIWKAMYSDGADLFEEQIEITSPGDGMLNLNFGALAPSVSPIFNCTFKDGALKIKNATAQGRYASFYLFNVVFSADNYVSWGPNYTYSGFASITEDGTFNMKFANDGSWPGKVINGIGLEAFSTSTPSGAGDEGTLAVYFDLILQK